MKRKQNIVIILMKDNIMILNPGEIICDKCNGKKTFPVLPVLNRITHIHITEVKCPKCKGTGKLDWIENVVGKKQNMVSPGVYVREVDVSEYIPNKHCLYDEDDRYWLK